MTHPDLPAKIGGIFFGSVQGRWEEKAPSAIQKDPVSGRQTITLTGFSGDAQADLTVHGGEEEVVHHYALDHYAAWQSEGRIAAGTAAAAIGENITTIGLTEENLCIGDIGTTSLRDLKGLQSGRQSAGEYLIRPFAVRHLVGIRYHRPRSDGV